MFESVYCKFCLFENRKLFFIITITDYLLTGFYTNYFYRRIYFLMWIQTQMVNILILLYQAKTIIYFFLNTRKKWRVCKANAWRIYVNIFWTNRVKRVRVRVRLYNSPCLHVEHILLLAVTKWSQKCNLYLDLSPFIILYSTLLNKWWVFTVTSNSNTITKKKVCGPSEILVKCFTYLLKVVRNKIKLRISFFSTIRLISRV